MIHRGGRVLEDLRVPIKIRLAALWLAVMLIYIYVDIFSFYKPGVIQGILAGRVWEFEISQGWALGALALMVVPSLMVVLSLIVKASVNRSLTIVVALLYIGVGIVSSIGETWAFYFVGHGVAILLLLAILWTAARWPHEKV